MKHRTTKLFWQRYEALPADIRDRADKAFSILKADPNHPSLHFKKVGTFWSARVDLTHRVLAVPDGEDLIWVWIGSHDEYDRMLSR